VLTRSLNCSAVSTDACLKLTVSWQVNGYHNCTQRSTVRHTHTLSHETARLTKDNSPVYRVSLCLSRWMQKQFLETSLHASFHIYTYLLTHPTPYAV
jgi:hypothetical protein